MGVIIREEKLKSIKLAVYCYFFIFFSFNDLFKISSGTCKVKILYHDRNLIAQRRRVLRPEYLETRGI